MTMRAKAWQLLAYAVFSILFATILAQHTMLLAKARIKYLCRKLYSGVDKRSYRI